LERSEPIGSDVKQMNEITIYQQIADPVSAIENIGRAITLSRIFGCQNEAQGQVLALECLAKKLPPLALAEQYHLIDGKLSMKADAMLACFEDAGGKYEIKEYSPEACEILFSRGKNELTVRITWAMAQQEKWPYGKGKELKTTWSTPIGRQDMLWARVVSRGVRRLAPGVVCGRYTPEEIQDVTEEKPVVATILQAKPVVAAEVTEDEEIVSTASVVTAPATQYSVASDTTLDEGPTTASLEEYCTEAQIAAIKSAIEQAAQTGVVDLPKRIKAKLAASGMEKLSDLSIRQANMLLHAIETKTMAAFFDASLNKLHFEESPF